MCRYNRHPRGNHSDLHSRLLYYSVSGGPDCRSCNQRWHIGVVKDLFVLYQPVSFLGRYRVVAAVVARCHAHCEAADKGGGQPPAHDFLHSSRIYFVILSAKILKIPILKNISGNYFKILQRCFGFCICLKSIIFSDERAFLCHECTKMKDSETYVIVIMQKNA